MFVCILYEAHKVIFYRLQEESTAKTYFVSKLETPLYTNERKSYSNLHTLREQLAHDQETDWISEASLLACTPVVTNLYTTRALTCASGIRFEHWQGTFPNSLTKHPFCNNFFKKYLLQVNTIVDCSSKAGMFQSLLGCVEIKSNK